MKFVTYTMAATLLGTPVLAGGMTPAQPEPQPQAPIQAAPVAPVSGDWTGGYVGAQLGYGNLDESPGPSNDGAIGGLTAGYDYDFGNFVLGGALDYDWSNIDTSGGSLDDIYRLKLRGGYDMGKTLVYATGGAAWADADIGGGSSDNGYFAGLGAEYKITPSISAGGEVLYHRFDDFDNTGVDLEATTVEAKVNYRF